MTGNPTPHFLSVCRPNYTALGCPPPSPDRPGPDRFVTDQGACAGSPSLVAAARRAFPCKDAALCAYAVTYTAVSPEMGARQWGAASRQEATWAGASNSSPGEALPWRCDCAPKAESNQESSELFTPPFRPWSRPRLTIAVLDGASWCRATPPDPVMPPPMEAVGCTLWD